MKETDMWLGEKDRRIYICRYLKRDSVSVEGFEIPTAFRVLRQFHPFTNFGNWDLHFNVKGNAFQNYGWLGGEKRDGMMLNRK